MKLTTKVLPGLHVGGSWNPDPPDKGWDVVLTVCTPEEVIGSPPARYEANWWMLDASFVDEPAVQALRELTVQAVRSGAKTLVRCHLGLNRSGLVVALAALDLTGDEPASIVAGLRARRSDDVLFNETFEQYVLGQSVSTNSNSKVSISTTGVPVQSE